MIITKYLGPTNHKGSRIKAIGPLGSVTVARQGGEGIEESYDRAVKVYCDKLGPSCRTFVRGVDPSGHNYIYIATTCPTVQL